MRTCDILHHVLSVRRLFEHRFFFGGLNNPALVVRQLNERHAAPGGRVPAVLLSLPSPVSSPSQWCCFFHHRCYCSAATATAAAIAIALRCCEGSHLHYEPAQNKTTAKTATNHSSMRLLLQQQQRRHPHTPPLSSLYYAA